MEASILYFLDKQIKFLIVYLIISFLAHLLTPIKWRSCEESLNYYSSHINNINADECQYLLPKKEDDQPHSVTTKIVHATDLELLVDYKFLALGIGLSVILAMSVDLTKILPAFLIVRHLVVILHFI